MATLLLIVGACESSVFFMVTGLITEVLLLLFFIVNRLNIAV